MPRVRFVLDPSQSQVWIEGSSSIHPIHATATGLEGWIELLLVEGILGAKPQVAGEVRVEVARLRSGNPIVDAETRRRIDAGRYPEIVGIVTGSTRLADDRVGLVGDLSFRGETCAVNGELEVELAEGRIHVRGSQEFDVRAWGLQPPKVGLLRVHPTITVRIDAIALPS